MYCGESLEQTDCNLLSSSAYSSSMSIHCLSRQASDYWHVIRVRMCKTDVLNLPRTPVQQQPTGCNGGLVDCWIGKPVLPAWWPQGAGGDSKNIFVYKCFCSDLLICQRASNLKRAASFEKKGHTNQKMLMLGRSRWQRIHMSQDPERIEAARSAARRF